MKDNDRKEYPDFEEFSPDGWEVVEKKEVPEYILKAEKQAKLNISNRGGKRPGAGRPVATTKQPKKQIRLPEDVVNWIQSDKEVNLLRIRKLMG